MSGAGPRRTVDATSLQGLAHPLRVQLLEQLTLYGPATATQLADRLHESSGAASYHLRQLERYGFVEEDPGRGTGRERWWRRVPGAISINTPELIDHGAGRDAATLVTNEFHRGRVARLDHWHATADTWPRDWQDASGELAVHLRVTAQEMAELTEQVETLLFAWRDRLGDRAGDELTDIEVQVAAFPLPPPGGGRRGQ
jgi:DNA-binding transcriptional ArsR family regulator